MTTAIGSYVTATTLKAQINKTDTADDTLLGVICDRVNQYIESVTKQPISPITSAAYTYDGNGLRRIFLPMPLAATTEGVGGARAVTLLEIAPYSGGTFETIASTDYAIRDRFGVGGPYRWLLLSDKPAGTYTTFPEGMANVRVTMTAGWAAIPDDVSEMAVNIAQRAWNAKEAGQQNVIGSDEMGRPSVAQYVSGRDRETLKRYTLRPPV